MFFVYGGIPGKNPCILFEETTAMKKSLTGKNYVKNECNVCYNPKGGRLCRYIIFKDIIQKRM